jgi:hypothetical protein
MSTQCLTQSFQVQAPAWEPSGVAQGLGKELAIFLFPVLQRLDERMEKRLVRTMAQTVQSILTKRSRAKGLLLWELGGMLLGEAHAKAGN